MYIPELIRKVGLRHGLRPMTIRTYRHCIKRFFSICRKEPKEVKKKDITDFMDFLIEKGACGNTLNVYLSALKFLYNDILGKRLLVNIRYSKTPKKLPAVMTKEEVAKLIRATPNPKHNLMVCLKYASGVRVGELVKLRVKDLEIDKEYGWVKDGKGGKDRLFIVAQKLKSVLKRFIDENGLEKHDYLFKGQKGGHITRETFRMIVKKGMKKAGISKDISPHTLRHSFSTHIVEQGDDLVSLQSLLGHASIDTTMRYIHCAAPKTLINVKSPYDTLHI